MNITCNARIIPRGTSSLTTRRLKLLFAAGCTSFPTEEQRQEPTEIHPVLSTPRTHPLRLIRRRHNLTQQMLADLTALSKSTIERAERGEPLSIYSCQQLCDYFRKTPEQLGLIPQR